MTFRLVYIISLIPVYLLLSPALFAQQVPVDTNYIRSFDKPNVIELFPGIYSTRFSFTTPGERKNDYCLVANSSGYMGTYLNYK